jgi:hypothetical protein
MDSGAAGAMDGGTGGAAPDAGTGGGGTGGAGGAAVDAGVPPDAGVPSGLHCENRKPEGIPCARGNEWWRWRLPRRGAALAALTADDAPGPLVICRGGGRPRISIPLQ